MIKANLCPCETSIVLLERYMFSGHRFPNRLFMKGDVIKSPVTLNIKRSVLSEDLHRKTSYPSFLC